MYTCVFQIKGCFKKNGGGGNHQFLKQRSRFRDKAKFITMMRPVQTGMGQRFFKIEKRETKTFFSILSTHEMNTF